MSSLLTKLGFAAIARGFTFRAPKQLRAFYQHARTLEEIRKRDINLVFDVGANRGFYSEHLRMGGYKGHIFSFEPVRECFDELASRAEGDPKWQVFNCALGSEAGEIGFNVIKYGGESVMSSVLEPSTFEFPTTKTTVPVRTFREVMKTEAPVESPRVFLKMDTQGFDLEVFKGSENAKEILLLQSEVAVRRSYKEMPCYTESLAVYRDAGFKLIDTFLVGGKEYIGELDALMGREVHNGAS